MSNHKNRNIMSKETESTEDALIYRIGQMVKENVELEQRVHQLVDDYNEVVHQLHGLEKRKDEDTAKHTLGETLTMVELCEKLEAENSELKKFTKAFDDFAQRNKLYIPCGVRCPYHPEKPAAFSMPCQSCTMYLYTLDSMKGVVCKRHLMEVNVNSPCDD